MNIPIKGKPYRIVSETRVKIHPDPLPKVKGEKYPKEQPVRYYTAVKVEPMKEKTK